MFYKSTLKKTIINLLLKKKFVLSKHCSWPILQEVDSEVVAEGAVGLAEAANLAAVLEVVLAAPMAMLSQAADLAVASVAEEVEVTRNQAVALGVLVVVAAALKR